MPPQLLEDDMSVSDDGPDSIPAKGKIPTKEEEAAAAEEDEDDEEDGEEYRVEKVLKHRFDGGELEYQIKWLGYDKKEDLTWEPIENLDNAQEALDEYHKKIGGPPEPPASKKGKGKGKGKRSASAAFDSPAVEASGKKHGRKSEVNGTPSKFELPAGSWEANVQRVTSIIEEDEPKGKSGKTLIALVEWVDSRKTQHKMEVLRRKCPQKLLNYYEQHLVFRNDGPAKEDE